MTMATQAVAPIITFPSVLLLHDGIPTMVVYLRNPGIGLGERSGMLPNGMLKHKSVSPRVLGCDTSTVQSSALPLHQATQSARNPARETRRMPTTTASSKSRAAQCPQTSKQRQIDSWTTWPLGIGCASTCPGLLATKMRWKTRRTEQGSTPEHQTKLRLVRMMPRTGRGHRQTRYGAMALSTPPVVGDPQLSQSLQRVVILMDQDTPEMRTTDHCGGGNPSHVATLTRPPATAE